MYDQIYLSKEFIAAYIAEIDYLLKHNIACGRESKSAVSNLSKLLTQDIYRCLNYLNDDHNLIDPFLKAELKTQIINLDTLRLQTLKEWRLL